MIESYNLHHMCMAISCTSTTKQHCYQKHQIDLSPHCQHLHIANWIRKSFIYLDLPDNSGESFIPCKSPFAIFSVGKAYVSCNLIRAVAAPSRSSSVGKNAVWPSSLVMNSAYKTTTLTYDAKIVPVQLFRQAQYQECILDSYMCYRRYCTLAAVDSN